MNSAISSRKRSPLGKNVAPMSAAKNAKTKKSYISRKLPLETRSTAHSAERRFGGSAASSLGIGASLLPSLPASIPPRA